MIVAISAVVLPSLSRVVFNFVIMYSVSSIKRTLSRVPKRTSDISLYNEPLFSGHLYKADADTKISCIWLTFACTWPLT